VTHERSAFGGADHGWQDIRLEGGAWTVSQAVSGSVWSSLRHADVARCHRCGMTGIERSSYSIYYSST
jgi:hypothetical protein